MFGERIAALAADRESGASKIVERAIGILRDGFSADADIQGIARAVVRAQPSMAPVWNAALAAVASREGLEAFAQRTAAAPTALTRTALDLFADRAPGHIVTISYSGSVAGVIEALHRVRPLRVTCSESGPAMEGRALANRLAALGVDVTCTADAALDASVRSADAVLVGADAVAARWFLNKTGTRTLAAAARAERVPVYVAASHDKFAAAAVAARLAVHGTWFEQTPLADVTSLIAEGAVLDAGMVRGACEALDRDTPQSLVTSLAAG
jgi:translation initiation factor 2B subunit (eIF-2B alpha/beta/delta family)